MRSLKSLPPLARTCLAVLAALAAVCWLAPLLGRYGPVLPDWESLSAAPGSAGHWFGTDAIGRDVFART
ncbi:peptide ABC transporter permease, partial [Lysobacter sp. 2RAB21]